MKRLRRIIFNGLTVLSLLLFVATVGLWVRCHFASDFIDYVRGERSLTVVVIDKTLLLNFHKESSILPFQGWTYSPNPANPGYTAQYYPTFWGRLGFIYTYADNRDDSGFSATRMIGLPFWLLCFVTAIAPLGATLSAGRRHRRANLLSAGRCLSCGYDLRATPDRCPECGTIPEKAKA